MSPLGRALPAMTALQATVALGMFSLSVMAPQLGVSVSELAALNTLMFSVGALCAMLAGRLLAKFGDWHVAAACAAATALGMLCQLVDLPNAAWLAVLLFGMAFGPETPASAAILTRLTPAARRPWIFSVRQTGNQIGAMTGSILLPALLIIEPRLPYVVVACIAASMAVWCLFLSRSEQPARATPANAPRGSVAANGGLMQVLRSSALRTLAMATLAYTAVQMCLNTFLMSLAVREWQFDLSHAAGLVALLQAAGLGGRLFWGWFAQRSGSARSLLGGIGIAMAVIGIALMVGWSLHLATAVVALAALLGFCASGWNGVLVAEVTRIAGSGRAGALTGTVLMFGYAGLAIAPMAFAGLAAATSMATAFIGLFACAGIAGAVLLLNSRD